MNWRKWFYIFFHVFFLMSAQASIVTFNDRSAFKNTFDRGQFKNDKFEDMICNQALKSPFRRSIGNFSYFADALYDFYPLCLNDSISLSSNVAWVNVSFNNFSSNVYAWGASLNSSDLFGIPSSGRMLIRLTTMNSQKVDVLLDLMGPSEFVGFKSAYYPLYSVEIITLVPSGSQPRWALINDVILGDK